MFHIINKYYNSWQIDIFKTIDVMSKYFKSQLSYQHIYIQFGFKLFYHLHYQICLSGRIYISSVPSKKYEGRCMENLIYLKMKVRKSFEPDLNVYMFIW